MRTETTLDKAKRLLRQADNFLTDGDEIEHITGNDDLARWAREARELAGDGPVLSPKDEDALRRTRPATRRKHRISRGDPSIND